MKSVIKIAGILAVFSIAYFGHRMVQSHLGENAVEALSFPIYTLEEGLKVAREQNKFVIADLSAIWCPSCRKLDEEVFANDLVSETISNEFVYVRLEHGSEAGVAFAKKHDLQGFPRILILENSGEKVIEMPLVFEPTIYNSNLQKILAMN